MYKSRRRPWVKLYCREWLTSTVRFDMTESDRSRFIDLLALAGDSKVPGIVCAGYDGQGHKSGYPIDWLASTMRCTVPELQKSLLVFKKAARVSITGPSDAPIISISSWKKYQSEYLRQIESLNRKKNLQSSTQLSSPTSGSSTQLSSPEEEGEVDGDGEEEVEVEDTAAAFSAIGFNKPFGHKPFKDVWLSIWAGRVGNQWVTELMEQTIQTCQTHNIKIPPQFYDAKRDVEKRENSSMNTAAPL